ncbi:hypothetical protein Tco_0284818 [Tanacetum coccineum]
MADNRTMAQLLQAPTEGYEDAIVIPEINANFELKHGLINLVQNKQFFGHDKEDPHAHIRYFNKITSTMRFPNVPSTSIKLMLFPFSLEGSARIWLEKEPPRSILTWDDLVSKFINQFFPPSKTTNLPCPHHVFFELHQLDTFYNALNANDQDSLNYAAGGNFLDKMPRECLRIIESKFKVRNSRNKAVVAKVSSNSSTPGISPDVAALTTEVSELKNLMKTMLIDKQKVQAPASVKAVEQSCVTCGGAHSYKNCPATDGNVYQDNIQEYVSQADAANFNQGNSNSRPPMVANQIRPPGTNFNQNRNFNQGQLYQPPTIPTPVYQAPPQQMQGVSKTNFENYVKANDVVLRNMQNQGQGLQNQMINLTEMLSKFITSNTASSSNSGTLPSQTVTNPHEHVNAITTRSGKTCEGPSTPLVPTPVVSTPLKEPEQNPKTSMDKMQKPSSENTAQVPPSEDHDSIFIEIPKPKAKKTVSEPNSPEPNSYQPKLPYPERMKVRENDKLSAQQRRFMKLFKQLHLEIGLKDALVEMPKFNKWLSGLLRNKEKLEEIAITTVNAECSAIIMNKVPRETRRSEKISYSVSSTVKTSDNLEKFTDELTPLNSLPLGDDVSILKNDSQEVNFQVHSNPLFEFDDNFKYSTINPLFDEMEEDVEIENSNEPGYLHNFASEVVFGPCTVITFSQGVDLFTMSSADETYDTSFKDSEPVQEEIDIFLVPDDLIPLGVENDDSKDEDNELPNLDHQNDPSIPRPPPDVEKCLEPEAGILITKVFKGVSKPYDFMADILPTLPTLVSDLTFILFLSSFLSFESKDIIFDPGIITFPFSYLNQVAFSMEVSCSKCCSP